MDAERIGAEEWNELQRNLEMSIPAYDRINRFATLGQVSKWRRMVQDRLPAKGRILEVGCGPGSFAEEVVGRDLVCLDPIPEMLRSAESRVNPKRTARGDSAVEFVEATAEDLPFDDNSFDAVCSLFSFRDWYDKRAGLSEALRVLKPGGIIVIVDPAKINRLHGVLGWLWMRIWVGTYARLIYSKSDHPWRWLTRTYSSFGTTRDYVRMLEDVGFTDVRAKVVFPGMATIWQGTSP
ncbi:MAG: class I SAM-dependent methyltransferase [Candidatus Thermoplasmatota archaeon]|nr:class I SAM-dependent methyltransferase [Candidatus Thermoplasmatota archaeon]MEE3232205.1 class I SAM-dependent methyltransferase [Candidatus Thermoplasmatota archaeon]MEE3277807.1 class I SAM-dependent methyltransferase [Candidatus Thermoplasmatota archaeon]MEE3318446.1 class I SAM-dependent methyltransferase [Candidatus Thermoplasmatota archaeon]